MKNIYTISTSNMPVRFPLTLIWLLLITFKLYDAPVWVEAVVWTLVAITCVIAISIAVATKHVDIRGLLKEYDERTSK